MRRGAGQCSKRGVAESLVMFKRVWERAEEKKTEKKNGEGRRILGF